MTSKARARAALMTRREVAAHLRVGLSTVDRLRRAGVLGPDATVGMRGVRLYRVHVEAYVERGTPPSGTPVVH